MKKIEFELFQYLGTKRKLLLIMKLTFLLTVVCFLNTSATVYSQATKFSFELKNQRIQDVLREIEKNSEFRFFYQREQVDVEQIVALNITDKTVEEILPKLFEGQKVVFDVRQDNLILIKPEQGAIESSTEFYALQQQNSVSGKVTDTRNLPLPGVTVVVKGTTQGTVTNADGEYSISNLPANVSLQFSFVGMKSQEIVVGSQTFINAIMEEETIGIDEVVAIGYGTVKKSDLTGSVSSIKMDELQATPLTSIDQGLGGRAAGVMVTQSSGMPGSVATIRIRGTNSLQGGNEPLYVIDGIPIYAGSGFGNVGGSTSYSGLSTLNPADIESIEILKDASATSIYGARAANGVVLITTKSGKAGMNMITFEATYGIQNVVKKIDVLNALEYAELANEAYTNDGLGPLYSESEIQQIRQNPKGTDWQDELFRPAPTQNYQLGFMGGDQKTTFSASLNYLNQDGIIRNSDFKRYSGKINLEKKILDNFKFGANVNLSRIISNSPRADEDAYGSVVVSAVMFNPNLPVFQDEMAKRYTLANIPGVDFSNPIADADEIVRENQAIRLLGNFFGEWEIISDLKARISIGTDLFNSKLNNYFPSYIYRSNGIGNAEIEGRYTTNWLNENTLQWDKEINSNNKFSLLGGITFQENYYEGFSASSQEFVNDILQENSLQSGAVYNRPTSSNTKWSLLSFLGRANYSYKERYLISISTRIDGSSRFGKNNKYAIFPSTAFAWRLIEEDFIKNINLFSNLKFRFSYGITGNQEIGLYNSLPTLTNTSHTLGRTLVTGFYPNKIPNPDLKWEKTSQYDVGIDFGFLENKFRVTADYYNKRTTDLIYNIPIPFTSGYSSALQNIGSMENKGFELAFESDIFTGKFVWTSNFNISTNKNKILELGGEEYKDIGGGSGHLKTGSVHRLIVDEPIGLFYGYVFDGIFQNQSDLDTGPKSPTNWIGGRRYKDLNGPDGIPDGIINAAYDRTVIGNPNPDFFGGFNNTFSYEGFELNVFLQYSYGNDIFNYNSMELMLPSGNHNVYSDLVNRWTSSNPSSIYPKATTNPSAVFSSAYIEDGSYLKLKTLTFSYLFPHLTSKYFSDLKFYLTGQNLLTFSNYRGFDPEVSYRGATNLEIGEDYGGYPQAKTFMMGIRFNIK